MQITKSKKEKKRLFEYRQERNNDMDTAVRTRRNVYDSLSALRNRVTSLASQSEDEALLADVVAMLSGEKRPCTYTAEEFAGVLREADEDYKAGRFVSQEELRERYGL